MDGGPRRSTTLRIISSVLAAVTIGAITIAAAGIGALSLTLVGDFEQDDTAAATASALSAGATGVLALGFTISGIWGRNRGRLAGAAVLVLAVGGLAFGLSLRAFLSLNIGEVVTAGERALGWSIYAATHVLAVVLVGKALRSPHRPPGGPAESRREGPAA